jgi:oligopeptide/dipeptide ABC transporter ATP-binding protein
MLAVRDVSLTVGRGEALGVVGESGCGKSTLARLVLRLIEPTSGTVTFDGTEITALLGKAALRRLRRRMAMVFQDPYSSLDPRYTAQARCWEPFRSRAVGAGRHPAEMLARSACPGAGRQPSAPAFGRPAPARRHRPRAGAAPDLWCWTNRPPRWTCRSRRRSLRFWPTCARAGPDLPVHQPRPGPGALLLRPDRGDVSGRGRRGAARSRRPPAPPLYPALMESRFAPDPAQRRSLAPLTGEIPSPFALPPGCAFAARCPHASDRCRAERPVLVGRPHPSRCLFPPALKGPPDDLPRPDRRIRP